MRRHRSGEMAWSVKGLHYKHEDLSLISRTHVQMPGMVAHIYKPSAGEVEAGGCLRLSDLIA